MRTPHFDLDLLRTLVAVVDRGGFVAASRALHCTQSAVSHQIQRLEERANTQLFERAGRNKRLTSSGEQLVSYARRILALNDEAHHAITHKSTPLIRVGLPEYFADDLLPNLLMGYSEQYPATRVDVRLGRSGFLREMVDSGDLDCALLLLPGGSNAKGELLRLPLIWLGNSQPLSSPGPLQLVTFDNHCAFRAVMIESLERKGISWRIAYTANSLADMKAAVRANLGVTALMLTGNHYGLTPFTGLPSLPEASVSIHHSPGTPSEAVRNFMRLTEETFYRQTDG